ncbi:MAG: NACHT domain-containing protein, partial [Nitrososphaerales archaeon]
MTQPQPSPDELRQQLAALERSLADLRAAGMGEAVLAPLRDQANVIRNRIVAGGDADGRDKIIQGDEVHGDKVMGDKIFAIADRSPEELLRLYLRSLADECCRLPLGVIHREFVRTGDEVPIPLPDVYVDLDVVVAPAAHKQRERTSALRLAHGEGGDRQPLLPTLARQESSRAVLLGDPGSGKTTFVNYLTYLLATGSPALPPDFAGLLPFRLVLREVASQNIPAGATRGTAQMLWEALGKDLVARLGQVAGEKLLPYLQARMADQGAFVLLDGLDEAPAARERRAVLVQSIAALAGSLGLPGGRSRILVTARPHAYTNKAWRLPGFAVFGLAPFNEGQVDRFVERWYGAARTSMKWSEATAREKAGRLNAALREREYLAALASRPLLLTLMATLHSSEGGQLPEDRADLYEETVKLLLGRWQRERELIGPDGELLVEPAIA